MDWRQGTDKETSKGIAARVWAEKQGDAEAQASRLATKLDELQRLKKELLRQKLQGEIANLDYQLANTQFSDEIEETERELEANASGRATLDAFVRFAELMLVNVAAAWQKAGPEQRQRVQNLLFPEGVSYSLEGSFLNRSNSSLFSMLSTITSEKGMLASPTGFEPVLRRESADLSDHVVITRQRSLCNAP